MFASGDNPPSNGYGTLAGLRAQEALSLVGAVRRRNLLGGIKIVPLQPASKILPRQAARVLAAKLTGSNGRIDWAALQNANNTSAQTSPSPTLPPESPHTTSQTRTESPRSVQHATAINVGGTAVTADGDFVDPSEVTELPPNGEMPNEYLEQQLYERKEAEKEFYMLQQSVNDEQRAQLMFALALGALENALAAAGLPTHLASEILQHLTINSATTPADIAAAVRAAEASIASDVHDSHTRQRIRECSDGFHANCATVGLLGAYAYSAKSNSDYSSIWSYSVTPTYAAFEDDGLYSSDTGYAYLSSRGSYGSDTYPGYTPLLDENGNSLDLNGLPPTSGYGLVYSTSGEVVDPSQYSFAVELPNGAIPLVHGTNQLSYGWYGSVASVGNYNSSTDFTQKLDWDPAALEKYAKGNSPVIEGTTIDVNGVKVPVLAVPSPEMITAFSPINTGLPAGLVYQMQELPSMEGDKVPAATLPNSNPSAPPVAGNSTPMASASQTPPAAPFPTKVSADSKPDIVVTPEMLALAKAMGPIPLNEAVAAATQKASEPASPTAAPAAASTPVANNTAAPEAKAQTQATATSGTKDQNAIKPNEPTNPTSKATSDSETCDGNPAPAASADKKPTEDGKDGGDSTKGLYSSLSKSVAPTPGMAPRPTAQPTAQA